MVGVVHTLGHGFCYCAANIYGEEIYDYDVLDNVRRMAAYPNGLGGYVQDYRYQYNASQRLTRIDNELGAQQWGFSHNGLGETPLCHHSCPLFLSST